MRNLSYFEFFFVNSLSPSVSFRIRNTKGEMNLFISRLLGLLAVWRSHFIITSFLRQIKETRKSLKRQYIFLYWFSLFVFNYSQFFHSYSSRFFGQIKSWRRDGDGKWNENKWKVEINAQFIHRLFAHKTVESKFIRKNKGTQRVQNGATVIAYTLQNGIENNYCIRLLCSSLALVGSRWSRQIIRRENIRKKEDNNVKRKISCYGNAVSVK